MNTLRTIRNYICYYGIEKEEFRVVKKDAYVSNFKIWRILNFFMVAVFGVLFIGSCFNDMMQMNRIYYLVLFLYSIVVSVAFLLLKKESIVIDPLIHGGKSTSIYRSGTPAAPLIVSIAKGNF